LGVTDLPKAVAVCVSNGPERGRESAAVGEALDRFRR
jgi:hypothetical protein